MEPTFRLYMFFKLSLSLLQPQNGFSLCPQIIQAIVRSPFRRKDVQDQIPIIGNHPPIAGFPFQSGIDAVFFFNLFCDRPD